MAPHPPGFFPPPLTIPPLSQPHKQTLILLHGRGSNAHTFGPDLLSTPFLTDPSSSSHHHCPREDDDPSSPSPSTLRTAVPHAKFVFPCAPRQRATIYKRSIINQWFDSWHLDGDDADHSAEEWRAVDGLRDTVAYLHGLIREEVGRVGAGNVVLGGISQGCAAGLMAMVLWEGEALGGYLGMCGWLPFEKDIREVVGHGEEMEMEEGTTRSEEDFDPFDRGDGDDGSEGDVPRDLSANAVRELRERLELEQNGGSPTTRPPSFDTPVFLGHGDEDEKVPVARGREATKCLNAAGFDVLWKEYRGLGHWFSADMLADMGSLLRDRAGWEGDGRMS
ncbi:hypothetical protein VTK56DRAFT_2581 [Thermocarpiscus australiensis]